MLWFSGINFVDSNLVSRCQNAELILKDAFLSISIHLNALTQPQQTLPIARIWKRRQPMERGWVEGTVPSPLVRQRPL